MRDDLDYYVILSENNPRYPLLGWEEDGGRFLEGKPVRVTEPIKLRLSGTAPPRPLMVDYHELPEPVFSDKVRNALLPLKLYGMDLHPAKIRMKQGSLDYWFLHLWNEVGLIDLEASRFEWAISRAYIATFQKLVLSSRVADEIPLKNRLVFVPRYESSLFVFHRTVRDVILSVNPVGCRFVPFEEYNEGKLFETQAAIPA